MRIDQRYVVVIALILTSSSFVTKTWSLSVTVNDVECVYEYVPYDGDKVSGNYVVVDHDIFWGSDHPGIDFTVTSPSDDNVHNKKGTSGDKFEFKAPRSGMYKFCFHNPYSTPETVSFYLHIGHIPNEHDLAKDEHLDPINVKIAELREALESVTVEQKYLKARDTRHRHTLVNSLLFPSNHATGVIGASVPGMANRDFPKHADLWIAFIYYLIISALANESTRKRVMFYTLAEYLLLACASGLQVVYIRRLFSKSIGYNRV